MPLIIMDQEFYKSKQLICIFPHPNTESEINTFRQSLGLRDLLRIPACIPLAVSKKPISHTYINSLADEIKNLRSPEGLLARVSAPLEFKQQLGLPYPTLTLKVEGPVQELVHTRRSGLLYEDSPLSLLISMPEIGQHSIHLEQLPAFSKLEIRSAYVALLELQCEYVEDSHCICTWQRSMIKWIAKLKKSSSPTNKD